jgi:hypothetical protein
MAAQRSHESDNLSPRAKRPRHGHPATGETHPAAAEAPTHAPATAPRLSEAQPAIDALQVYVTNALSGNAVCTLQLGQSATIFSVKRALHQVTGIPTVHQKLVHEDQTCEDDQLIKEIATRAAHFQCMAPGEAKTFNQLVHLCFIIVSGTLAALEAIDALAKVCDDYALALREAYNVLREDTDRTARSAAKASQLFRRIPCSYLFRCSELARGAYRKAERRLRVLVIHRCKALCDEPESREAFRQTLKAAYEDNLPEDVEQELVLGWRFKFCI